MNITDVTTQVGAHRKRRRVGRGEGSGWGKTAGRGHKGQGSRSGGAKEAGLLSEGGVFPLFRRLPKVGFNNKNFRTEYQIVNVADLEARFESGAHVTAAALAEIGLIRDPKGPVKVLGDGEIKKKLVVEAERFSAQAATKIEGCGGTLKRLGPQPKKKFVKRPKPAPEKPEGKGVKGEKGGAPEAAAAGEGEAPKKAKEPKQKKKPQGGAEAEGASKE
jgi:large subunit ribosomal protein L15